MTRDGAWRNTEGADDSEPRRSFLIEPVVPFLWPSPRVVHGDGGYFKDPPYLEVLEGVTHVTAVLSCTNPNALSGLAEVVDIFKPQRCSAILVGTPRELEATAPGRDIAYLLPESPADRHRGLALLPLRGDERSNTQAIVCRIPDEPYGLLFHGSDLGPVVHAGRADALNIAQRLDPILANSWNIWFRDLWRRATRVFDRAAFLAAAAIARSSEQIHNGAIQAPAPQHDVQLYLPFPLTHRDAEDAVSFGAELERAAESAELGLPDVDPLTVRMARLFDAGSIVTIDRGTRAPPLAVPVPTEWFGEQRNDRVGAASRRVEYRIELVNEHESDWFERIRQTTSQLLRHLGCSISDGQWWVPDRAWPSFERHMWTASREGQAALRGLIGDSVVAFVETQRERIRTDLEKLLRRAGRPNRVPEADLDDLLVDARRRIEAAFRFDFVARVNRVRATFASSTGSRWASNWSQAFRLLRELALVTRQSLADDRFRRRLPHVGDSGLEPMELLEAMNVLDDRIVSEARASGSPISTTPELSARIRTEITLLNAVGNVDVPNRDKADAVLKLIEGDSTALRRIIARSGCSSMRRRRET
jgi:hypothetical protein